MANVAASRVIPWTDGALPALSRFIGIAEGQGGRAVRLLSLIFMMSLALVMLKAAQNGIFLSAYSRAAIPWAFAASAVTLASMSAISVSAAARLGPVRLASIGLSIAATLLLALRVLLVSRAHAVPFIIYVVIEATCGILLIQVWSVVSEAIDPRSAKRLLPLAGVGASLAWTFGGLLVPSIVSVIGAKGLLITASLALLATLAVVRAVAKLDLKGNFAQGNKTVGLVDGWKKGLGFVARVPLMRLSVALSMLALITEQLMDFQLMAAARERCGSPTAIASFFGTYFGITSAVSLCILIGFSGRVLSRIGASQALAVTPVVTVLAAAAALVIPGFAAVVLLRASDRVLKQSLWSNATEQTQTPLPVVSRAQARALSRGVIAPCGYAISAVVLASLPAGFNLRWLTLATLIGTGLMTAIIVIGVRNAYVLALRRAIDDRNLDLAQLGARDRPPLDLEACRALESELKLEDEDRAVLATELLSTSESPAAASSLLVALQHRSATVRSLALEGLGRLADDSAAEPIAALLQNDLISDVRRAAARALRRIEGHDRMLIAAFEAGTADTDRQVRALCEVAVLERRNPEGVRLGTALLPFIEGDDGALREAALATLPRRATRTPEVCEALRHSLRHADLATRLAALRVVTTMRVRALLPDVGALFNDPRTAPIAISQLTEWGDEALGAVSVPALARPDGGDPTDDGAPSTVAPSTMLSSAESSEDAPISRLLSHADAGVRERATRALGDMVRGGRHRPLPRQIVEPLLEREIGLAYGLHAIIAGIQTFPATSDSDPADVSFLRRELELRVRTGRHRILQLLSLLASRKLVRVIEAGLRRETPNRDAQVAELLEMTLKPALARKVVPLFDRISTRERLEAAASLGLAQPAALADPLDAILALDDAHIRGCAMIVYGPRFAERAPSVFDAESALIPLFERMRFLRSVPLFAELSGDDLRMVGEILEQVEYDADDPVFHKGDPGEDLFLVLRGRVAIRDGTKELAMLREREFFGELAVLDREPRSADAVCAEDTSLLRLRSADLGELMARRPQIQEGIMIVLVRKIRALNQRLSL